MVDIKTIEGAYKREFGVKKINKGTKKWKKFYNAYRKKKGAVSTSKPAKKSKAKSKMPDSFIPVKSSVRSTSMTFNGKKYQRTSQYWGTKEAAKEAQKTLKDIHKKSAILDKRKAGYFFWVRDK